MGNIGDTFPYSVPTVGSAGPTYATTIDNILTEAITRLSAKVPLSSLSYNANLDLTGQALLNAAYVSLINTSVSPGASPFCRLVAYNGDLWYVSPSGQIQLTTGSALNSASIGGITGNYGGANPAQLTYVAAQTRYDAYANFGTSTWAYMRALGFDIAAGATSAVFARLLFGGASNLTFTLPPTLPAAANTAPIGISDTGAITHSPSWTISPTLSGSAQYKHTNNRQKSHVPFPNECNFNSGTPGVTANIPGVSMTSVSGDWYIPIGELTVGNQVQSVTIVNNGATSVIYTLYKTAGSSAMGTVAGATATSAASSVTLTPTTPTPMVAGDQYYVRCTGNAAPFTVYYITATYSNP